MFTFASIQHRSLPLAVVLGLLSSAWRTGLAQEHEAKTWGDPYLLDSDPVSGGPLGPIEKQVILEHEGRELRFSSKENAGKFQAAPAKYLPGVDHQVVQQQLAYYPTDTCAVSGEKLGEMGDPINLVYRNRLIRLCCKGCKPDFDADPAKFLRALDERVIARQRAAYPSKTCVVSGDPLGDDAVERVFGNRLVRFCCEGCPEDFRKDPRSYLAKIKVPQKSGG